MRKIKWERPKLIIITRGKPDEMLLVVCKIGGNPAMGLVAVEGCYNSYGAFNPDGSQSHQSSCYESLGS